MNQIKFCSDTSVKIYYYHFLGKNVTEIEEIVAMEAFSVEQKDYVAILLHKMRARNFTITFSDR